ncbi:helix-turn-helix transcriptional regulator [Paracoccus sediminilitoris]|uniref:helix-turn-helix transcriptional regulator n=1 Tax=Paracoccus sediminilitoris TaxID=2202419 RepID=UPI00272BF3FD|nr:transcriptional regulator [Paracoccus sediminilitoris]
MKRRAVYGDRPPAYPSKEELAAELCFSESTVDSYVARGLLPKPRRIGGSVRWCWAEVEAHLVSGANMPASPFMEALRNAT